MNCKEAKKIQPKWDTFTTEKQVLDFYAHVMFCRECLALWGHHYLTTLPPGCRTDLVKKLAPALILMGVKIIT